MDDMDSRNALMRQLMTRVRQDEKYRYALLTNAKDAVEEELGITLDDDVTIHVLQRHAKEYYIVLPPPEVLDGPEALPALFY